MNTTTKRHPRSLSEAFPHERFDWADRRVMDAFPAPRWPFEAASACSEFGHDEPTKPRLTLLQRIKQFFRAQQIKRLRP